MTATFSGDWHAGSYSGTITTDRAADYGQFLLADVNRMILQRIPRRQGAFSAKITVKQNDYDHNPDRAEYTQVGTTWGPGDEIWIARSVMLDPTFPGVPGGDWFLFGQLFGETGGTSTGSPPFAWEISPAGQFQITVRGGVKATPFVAAPREVGYFIGATTTGEWHDFLVHIKFSTGSDGLIEAWHKVATASFTISPQASDAGVNVLTVGGVVQHVYPEIGEYRHTETADGILYDGGLIVRLNRSDAETLFAATPVNLPWNGVFGRNVAGSAPIDFHSDSVIASKFNMPFDTTIRQMHIYIQPSATTFQDMKLCIWAADNGADPGTLLGQAASFRVLTAGATQWYASSSLALSIPAGDYFLGAVGGPNGSKFYCQPGQANDTWDKTIAGVYATPPSDPFNGQTGYRIGSGYELSIYADYDQPPPVPACPPLVADVI